MPINNYYNLVDNYKDGFSRTKPVSSQVNDSLQFPHSKQITYEPAITFKGGGEKFKFMIQTGYSIADNRSSFKLNPYNYSPFYFRMGLNFSIGFKKKHSGEPRFL